MIKLLNQEIQKYINANLNADLHSLLLKKSPFPEVSMQELVQQIKGRKVAEKKFPFLNQENIIFPPNLNLEQASSQDTADFKKQFFKGKKFMDLTCGFGIDAYFLSQNFEEITLIEQNTELLDIVKHNWEVLGRKANFINQKLEDFLTNNKEKFDLIYLDPARRDNHNRKVFLLEDLSPNIIEIQEQLSDISTEILIKLSPLIDIQHLVYSLKNIYKIWIIAVKNEVKEVLVYLKKTENQPEISCINLQSSEPEFHFNLDDEKNCQSEFSAPKKYIYIPNSSVLKSGAFNLVSEKFGLRKLHQNTHIYTSEEKIEHFPGRIFETEEINSKAIKKGEKFNIITKNFPLKPEEIKKKYKIKDGGNQYLIAVKSLSGNHFLVGKLLD
ncbi:THUMP-like domain-containing protein [Cloacibacterium normanense]|uniref:THUMP-like domain-containing protein n=1 Tax=Cloacibacterium normanense TaxID=237258 RepID=UPI00391D50CA